MLAFEEHKYNLVAEITNQADIIDGILFWTDVQQGLDI